jgi:hypothetical protein
MFDNDHGHGLSFFSAFPRYLPFYRIRIICLCLLRLALLLRVRVEYVAC